MNQTMGQNLMRSRSASWLAAALLVATLCGISASHAAGPSEHYWYDGQQKRPLWLDAGRVADFSGAERTKAAVVKAMPTTKAAEQGMSPLFRDGADEQARSRALPGGVVVHLRQALPDDQARAWLKQRGLVAVREIGTMSGLWLVESEPGTASLRLANKLHEGGEFVSASPNWWQPRQTK